MPGLIIGAQGYQRSGKTLLMYLIADSLAKSTGLKVYSNIIVRDPNWIFINSVDEIPLDFEQKIVFIDEIYNGADALNYKHLNEISIFVNTLGKQNTLFMYTTIDFNMVYNRIRNQTNVVFLVKKERDSIFYRIVNSQNLRFNDVVIDLASLDKSKLHYDTNYIPLDFNWNMKNFRTKLIDYYREEYPELLRYIV